METQTETQRPNNGQLIFVPHKDTIRLLEVYVKRSLSLNEGTLGDRKAGRKEKWVTMPRKQRRHSSDPSIHLGEGLNDEEIGPFAAVEPQVDHPETRPEELEKPAKKSKKNKKPSFWKSFLGIFSRKSSDDKDEEQDSPSEIPEAPSVEEASESVVTCLPTTPAISQRKKSMGRKSIKRRFSKRRISVIKPFKDLNVADITRVEDVISVEPTLSYYEKVSEELEKIIHEVKEKEEAEPLSDEEVLNRIIDLTKQEGDAIDDKLKDNPTLSSFFQRMSYSSFQKLADAYLETEASPTHNPPTVLPTAPELVKLAFTLDFTARIAGLSKQNIGHITGLGNRYLQDRFEYQQACSDHPVSDSDD
ncbi:uncharacterized protein LOC121950669 [Plectropomus leopardus]|uniref:uncharacterized protein LOC121950669 n=1 Tax=Plectropomus leopardus TaxID=160734 RepID=UPI001C4D1A1D|nr:uncharacterized protein LOC121950669 [Plectropomus leopardus]